MIVAVAAWLAAIAIVASHWALSQRRDHAAHGRAEPLAGLGQAERSV